MDAAGWLESLGSLRDDQRAVIHQPETPRYARARAKLRYLLTSSVVPGVLFCFYDGTESSPGFRSAAAARAHALSTGFREVLDEDIDRD